ncbi:hypothetical protein [Flagellimonas myxillae]|uniref:hypothetical protein n=1 Tax=Flagellimonas myxillae TaxID=2942214 RepID=UPI00201F7240|nr:hypothetical protein [Muricauda myxillae]MCL6266936.1 hypothetical protein [Muricauda myxillae]
MPFNLVLKKCIKTMALKQLKAYSLQAIKMVFCTSLYTIFLMCVSFCFGQQKQAERIYFDSEMESKSIPSFEIFSMNPEGKEIRQHTFDAVPRRANTSPKFSPDGEHVIFGTYKYGGYKVAIAKSDFSQQRKFTKGPHYTYVGSWSPDGKKVAYNKVDTKNAPYYQGDFEIFVTELDGTSDINLSNTKGSDFGPIWSPDGRKIFFGSDRSGNSDIYEMDADGKNVKNLTNTMDVDEFGFSLSPDGSMIAFHAIPKKGQKRYIDLYTMSSDGSGRKNLTHNQNAKRNLFVPYYEGAPPIFYGTSWSSDGKTIAFSSKRNSPNFQVFTIGLNGQELKQLTHNKGNNVFPVWHSR